jgi:large subunit ribosomal protein L35
LEKCTILLFDARNTEQEIVLVSFISKGETESKIINSSTMPKVKTHSGAKKTFRVTGSGEITFQKSGKRHILTKKSKKRKRHMRTTGVVAKANQNFVKRLLRMK